MYKEGTAMKHKISYTTVFFAAVKPVGICGALLLMFSAFCLAGMAAEQAGPDKPLIIYYSRTGHCRLIVDTIRKHIDADVLEIKDTRDRSGTLGYMSAGIDSFFDRDTVIEPARPDLSGHDAIILVSPIWNWKLSVPIRTLIRQGGFNGKSVAVVTTGNNEVNKYSQYGDDAPFLKRFFRDYIRGKKTGMQQIVLNAEARVIAHHHVATQEKPLEEIRFAANGFADVLARQLALRELPHNLLTDASGGAFK